MKNVRALFLGLALFSSISLAQSGGGYTITKSVVAGGGGHATGGTFTMDATIGQPRFLNGTSQLSFVMQDYSNTATQSNDGKIQVWVMNNDGDFPNAFVALSRTLNGQTEGRAMSAMSMSCDASASVALAAWVIAALIALRAARRARAQFAQSRSARRSRANRRR